MARPKKTQPATTPAAETAVLVDRIARMTIADLRREWRAVHGADAPAGLTKDLVARALSYRLQELALGGLSRSVARTLRELGKADAEPRRQVKTGSIIVREYDGVLHEVMVVPGGFCWQGKTFDSLSTIAKIITGTNWNGPRFFGLRSKRGAKDQDKAEHTNKALRSGRRSSLRDDHFVQRGAGTMIAQDASGRSISIDAEPAPQ